MALQPTNPNIKQKSIQNLFGGVAVSIIVPFNGRYTGAGSKQTTVNYAGAPAIMSVESNLPNNMASSAVIENLIIDGNNVAGTTGILLENVYSCLIRNLTIMNCEVGIKVRLTDGYWSHANRFEHIRMMNVKTGILFEGTQTAKDFSYTTIDNVGISLAGNSTDVGIKIGTPNANLYCAFIKATVWLAQSGGTGLEVNGDLKFNLANLEVEQDEGYAGRGLTINSGASVSDNQFMLTALGLLQVNRLVVNSGGYYDGGITVVPP
jgi:hypothetical protein